MTLEPMVYIKMHRVSLRRTTVASVCCRRAPSGSMPSPSASHIVSAQQQHRCLLGRSWHVARDCQLCLQFLLDGVYPRSGGSRENRITFLSFHWLASCETVMLSSAPPTIVPRSRSRQLCPVVSHTFRVYFRSFRTKPKPGTTAVDRRPPSFAGLTFGLLTSLLLHQPSM